MSSYNKTRLIQQTWNKANIHRHASVVGIPYDLQDYKVCECCDQPIKKEPISMWEHTKQFQIFGFGYPLWFSFVKYCIFLVVILIATNSGNQLYQATKENYDFCYGHSNHQALSKEPATHKIHQAEQVVNFIHLRSNPEMDHLSSLLDEGHLNTQKKVAPLKKGQQVKQKAVSHDSHHVSCTSFMIYFANIHGDVLRSSFFLKGLSFLIHLITLIAVRNMILKQQQYFDERTTSLSDYSIILKNLPQIYGIKGMVTDLFQAQFGKSYGRPDSEIKQIYYIFESQKMHHINKQKKQLHEQLLNAINHQKHQEIQQIEKKMKHLDSQLEQVTKQLSSDLKRDYIKCDKMIVIMNTEADKAQVLSEYEEKCDRKTDFSIYFKHPGNSDDKKIKIDINEAPQPNQINWQHIDQSDVSRKYLIVKGYLFTFLFLALVTVVFYFIMLAKTKLFLIAMQKGQHQDDPSAKWYKILATMIVYVAIFGVILFNKFVMGKVLHKFVHMEKHAYNDKQNHSFSIKYALGMFFTTALMTLAVQAITFKNFYSHPYGVIQQQTIMFFVTAFFVPLVWLIHPYNLFKKLELGEHQNKLIHQDTANQLIEDFPYDLGKRYAQILEIMWFTFLYSKLIPLGSFLIVIGLILYYWVDKYNFLRRSALKEGLSGKMAILGLKSLDVTLFLPHAGSLLFQWILSGNFSKSSAILCFLGILYLFVPITKLIWKFNGQKFLLEQKPYDQAKYLFKQHYLTLHPVYKHTHKKQVQQFKKLAIQHERKEYQKVKMYGTGRGSYSKDQNQQKLRNSKLLDTSRTSK